MPVRGQHVEPVTDDLKERFLDLIGSGYKRDEAAAALGASARQLRSLCNPSSHRYDDDFARRYLALTERGGEQQHALAERLESAAIERGLRNSDSLLVKLLAIYHPDWEVHRPQALRMSIDVQVDELKVLIASASEDTLRALVADYEQRQLPPPEIEA